MKKIDWFILKKFLGTFLFSILLFTAISIVVDISEKADDFVKSQLGFGRIVTNYYAGFVPYIMALLFPLFVFISVIFFTSKMAMKSEIISILANGISFNRWLRPYWVGGFLLSTLLWFGTHFIVPKADKIRTDFQLRYVDVNSTYNALLRASKAVYMQVDSFSYVSIYNFDTTTKRAAPVNLYVVKNYRVTKNIRAAYIQWDTIEHKWILNNVVERNFDGMQEHIVEHPSVQTNFSFTPKELVKNDYTKNVLTTPELIKLIESKESRGEAGVNELKVERYRRDATCITLFILILMGATSACRRVRGGSGRHLAIGIFTAFMFVGVDRFSTVFATKGNLPPMLAAWVPNIIFSVVAFMFYRKAPK